MQEIPRDSRIRYAWKIHRSEVGLCVASLVFHLATKDNLDASRYAYVIMGMAYALPPIVAVRIALTLRNCGSDTDLEDGQ